MSKFIKRSSRLSEILYHMALTDPVKTKGESENIFQRLNLFKEDSE